MLCDESRAELSDQVARGEAAAGDKTEAAVVEYAAPWRRLAAGAVDALLVPIAYYLVSFFTGFFFSASSHGDQLSGNAASQTRFGAWIAAAVVWWLYCILMERSANQGTLGKMLLNIAVTDAGGQRISLGRAVGRNLAKIVSGALLPINWIMVAFTGKKRGLHDVIAGSMVVEKK